MRIPLIIRRPDDWHIHLRDGAMLKAVLPYTAREMGRAIIMPNLKPPVVTTAQAAAYRERILAAVPKGSPFQPLMTAYLTDGTDPQDIAQGFKEGILTAVKLYPAHATTNSEHGVTDLRHVHPVLKKMQDIGMPLLIHGEVTDKSVDVFDREKIFIEAVLAPLMQVFPRLKIVLEHITTKEAAHFVRQHASNGKPIAATITAHHLIINRNHIFEGGIRPHMYCLPVAKREEHRLALRQAATSGEPWFFLGTDSAPHPVTAKETSCGCAGIFTAASALALYADVFAEENALDKLEAFASLNGPAFYGLPPNEARVILEPGNAPIISMIDVSPGISILPFRAGEDVGWTVRPQLASNKTKKVLAS